MGKLLIDGSGNAKGSADADHSNVDLKSAGPVSAEQLIAAVAMVLRDEINIIRALGLIGLAARSVDDIVNAIKGKLT